MRRLPHYRCGAGKLASERLQWLGLTRIELARESCFARRRSFSHYFNASKRSKRSGKRIGRDRTVECSSGAAAAETLTNERTELETQVGLPLQRHTCSAMALKAEAESGPASLVDLSQRPTDTEKTLQEEAESVEPANVQFASSSHPALHAAVNERGPHAAATRLRIEVVAATLTAARRRIARA